MNLIDHIIDYLNKCLIAVVFAFCIALPLSTIGREKAELGIAMILGCILSAVFSPIIIAFWSIVDGPHRA